MSMGKLACFLVATLAIYAAVHLVAWAIILAYRIANRILIWRNSKRMEGK